MERWKQWSALVGNIFLQAVGSLLSHLVAPWYGPVSLVVPFFYSSTLLSNMLIFSCLGETFTKNMRVGTHVIVVAVILLPIVGPTIQEGQDMTILMKHFYSMGWFVGLIVVCTFSGCLLICGNTISKYSMNFRVMILLMARASSISINLTVSRAFILGLNHEVLWLFIVLKILSGGIYTYAIVIQSSTVEQASFVPLNATTIIVVNALTGIFIWEDWKVVFSWYGYICIFILLGLGCDLLLSVPLLNAENPEFGATKRASTLIILSPPPTSSQSRRSISSMTTTTNRSRDIEDSDGITTTTTTTTMIHRMITPRVSRIDAWKQVVSPTANRNMDHNKSSTSSLIGGNSRGLAYYSDTPMAQHHGPTTPSNASTTSASTNLLLGAAYSTPQRIGRHTGGSSTETESLLVDVAAVDPSSSTGIRAETPHMGQEQRTPLLSRLLAVPIFTVSPATTTTTPTTATTTHPSRED